MCTPALCWFLPYWFVFSSPRDPHLSHVWLLAAGLPHRWHVMLCTGSIMASTTVDVESWKDAFVPETSPCCVVVLFSSIVADVLSCSNILHPHFLCLNFMTSTSMLFFFLSVVMLFDFYRVITGWPGTWSHFTEISFSFEAIEWRVQFSCDNAAAFL